MAGRVYKTAAIYDARIIGMRNLWIPSREYMGKPTEKPNYLASVIIKKTRANWFEEPALADFTRACQELYTAALSHVPFQQVQWPIKDGDVNEAGRAPAEWRKGQWLLTGSSTSAIEVTMVQNGVPTPLRNQAEVKNGDYVAIGTALAVKMNDPRGVKCYLNKVMFMAPGEEIVIGTSVSAAELMAGAKAQGLNVTGFGGGGAPQQGFGFAPTPVPAVVQTATGPFMTPHPQAGFASPSNGPQTGFAPSPVQPPAGNGFATPGGFNAPTGFPPRQ
jgi:hypothetical protein